MIAFGASLAFHSVFLIVQGFSLDWLRAPQVKLPLQVVYEHEIAQQELKALQQQLAREKRNTLTTPTSPTAGERTLIRVPDRPSLSLQQNLTALVSGRSAFVDLTNLVDAAQGDPVLLSYFSAIREQIQLTANRQAWMSGAPQQGVIYIAFVLHSDGAVQNVEIVTDRSAPAELLRDIALRIVNASAPFPPFPPSIPEPEKTIVVPLEFLLSG